MCRSADIHMKFTESQLRQLRQCSTEGVENILDLADRGRILVESIHIAAII
jgi:hypothetical protein